MIASIQSGPTLPDSAATSEAAFKKFAVESWVLTSIAIVLCAIRTYSRARSVGVRNFRTDDYLVWAGVVRYAGMLLSLSFTSINCLYLDILYYDDSFVFLYWQNCKGSREYWHDKG